MRIEAHDVVPATLAKHELLDGVNHLFGIDGFADKVAGPQPDSFDEIVMLQLSRHQDHIQ